MRQLFGTDGIRGAAGEYPLDPATVRRFGAALAHVLREEDGGSCRVALGRDTRESGVRLRDAVLAGLASVGGTAVDAGVISTPGLANALVAGGFEAGVMISASHNHFRDNGLKAFGSDGMKLSDELELRVEERMLSKEIPDPPAIAVDVEENPSLVSGYITHLEGLLSPRGRLNGIRLVLDCANGSACTIAPEVFRYHGAEILCIGNTPNGVNINRDCGSLHLNKLAETVRKNGYDLGIAFDGDADRCLAVDRTGRVIDGDHILYLAGRRLHRTGQLRGNAVVATIMSNLWLEKRFKEEGITLHRAPVGDKYVLERMLAEDIVLGGEQSGHVIFREHATTGDGILTGLLLIDTLLDTDTYMLLADFAAYCTAQGRVDALYRDPEAWTAATVRTTAHMGKFSSDRTIREYAQGIWHLTPVTVPLSGKPSANPLS